MLSVPFMDYFTAVNAVDCGILNCFGALVRGLGYSLAYFQYKEGGSGLLRRQIIGNFITKLVHGYAEITRGLQPGTVHGSGGNIVVVALGSNVLITIHHSFQLRCILF